MKRRSLLIGVFVFIVVVVAVRWRGGLNSTNQGVGLHTTGGKTSGTGELASSAIEPLQILSDELTPTGRVFTVSKVGHQRRAIFPPGENPSRQEIEQLAFPPDPKPIPMVPTRTLLNPHLSFYGLVVDEKTNSVAGAKVEAIIQVMNGDGPTRPETVRLTSGADGRFALERPWGQLVMITVSKSPEFIGAPPQWFQYGPVGNRPRHSPNVLTPVVFELQSVQQPEPLFAFERQYRTANTGEPVRVDLATGMLVKEGGDLLVSIHCPELFNSGVRYPWKLTVQAVDGGVVESKAERIEFMHEAPASGYITGFSVEYGPNSPKYDRQHDGNYFVRSRNGQNYAKMFFYMHTRWDERGVPFGIKAVVNTNASRNLQTPLNQ